MVYNSLGVDKCIKLYSHHHDHDEKQFYYPKSSLALPLCSQPQLTPSSLGTTDFLSVTRALLFFPESYINGNILSSLLCLAPLI